MAIFARVIAEADNGVISQQRHPHLKVQNGTEFQGIKHQAVADRFQLIPVVQNDPIATFNKLVPRSKGRGIRAAPLLLGFIGTI